MGSLIAMGDPVGPPDVARALIWRFREEADRLGLRPVFYQVGESYWQTYLDLGLGLVKLGEEAMVPLHDFGLEGRERADLRQAWNRGKRGGLSFRVAPVEEVPSLLPRLHAISNAWLEDKAGEEKGSRSAATTRITWCASRWRWSRPKARSWPSPTCGRHRPAPSCRWT